MPASLSTVSALLKEIYEPDIQDQLNNDLKAWRRIEKTSEGITNEMGGKYVTFALKVGRNQGIGARNESEALPTAGQQVTTTARVGAKYLYGSIQFTGQTLKLADTNKQAFASAVDLEITGIKNDVTKDLNFQFYGSGTGVRATVTADGVNTVTVDNVQYLEVNMVIDILASDITTVQASARVITAINTSTKVVTYSGADVSATTGAGSVIVRTGNANRELTGIGSIIKASGTLYNVDPTVVPQWKSVVSGNGGTPRALTEALMIKMTDDIATNGGGIPTVVFCNKGVRRAYFNLLKTDRRFVNTQKFEGGFTGLAFTTDDGDIPVVSDVDAPPGSMKFVNEKEIKLYRESDWSWMDEDGNKFQRVIGFDAYQATLFMYAEVGTHRRNAHGSLDDITEG
jgi:hypothetical protein